MNEHKGESMLNKTYERYRKDFIGKEFGRLFVIDILKETDKFNNVYCLVKCKCQKSMNYEFKVRLNHLKGGITKSCGCLQKEKAKASGKTKIIDMTGKKFGFLTALRIDESKKSSNTYWICRCDCGNLYSTTGSRLRLKPDQSCGCQVMKRRLKTIHKGGLEKALVKLVLRQYKTSAKRRKLSFDLTYDDFEKIISSNCEYCGSKPLNHRQTKYLKQELFYNGVDRKDSREGYNRDNCVPCCFVCNRAKSDLSLKQWEEYINKIVNYNLERTKNETT